MNVSLFVFVFGLFGMAQFTFSSGTAKTSNSGSKSVRLLNEVTSNAELSKFGGNRNVKTEASGYFKTKQINGCWYIIDSDGYLFIKGRSKDIINVAGMKFFPQEVEAILNAIPGVQESCVFAHRHELFGEVPHAQVVLADPDTAPVGENELKEFLGQYLAHYKIPEKIEVVSDLVRTASGKLVRDEQRIKLRERAE